MGSMNIALRPSGNSAVCQHFLVNCKVVMRCCSNDMCKRFK